MRLWLQGLLRGLDVLDRIGLGRSWSLSNLLDMVLELIHERERRRVSRRVWVGGCDHQISKFGLTLVEESLEIGALCLVLRNLLQLNTLEIG